MRTGLQGVENELGLTPAQVNDPGHPLGNRVVQRCHVAIHEQVVVPRPGPLDGGGDDLHPGRDERDLDWAADRRAVGRRRDLHLRAARALRPRDAGQQCEGAERQCEPRDPDCHASLPPV